MAEAIEFKAAARAQAGKGAARAMRRQGRVPGVLYGDNKPAESVSVDFNELKKFVGRGNFLSTVFEIDVDGARTRVIAREVQLDPVRDLPIHVDFLRLAKGAKIAVEVPVHVLNEDASPGLKRGGALNLVRHTVELYCPADAIPEFIEIDLTGAEIGDSIHISAIKLPEGCSPVIQDRDFTIATIAGRLAEPAEGEEAPAVEAEGAAEEPEEEEEGKE